MRSLSVFFLLALAAFAQDATVLKPARVFDGETSHEGWAVRVRGARIEAAGPAASIDTANAKVIELPGATLLPGLVEGHSHILLHPYNETPWNDQVMHEGLALRAARAVNHLRATLMAGFTTVRDLGTEGAGYADVELNQAVNQGIVPGPRVLTATRAIVATGSYAPKGFALEFRVPQGAEEADGIDSLTRVVRDQIGHGADWIKLYGDYRWGAGPGARPTFSLDEMKLAVETAKSAGVPVAVHSSTPEGMRRATLAGAETIEHGDDGTPELHYAVSDLGASFGTTGRSLTHSMSKGNLKAYQHSKFIRKTTSEYVDFYVPSRPALIYLATPKEFFSRVDMRWIGSHIPRSDAQWIGGLLAQLSPDQIRDAFRAAGYTPDQVNAYAAVVEGRIAELNRL